jgi:hypothetical protein
MRVGRGTNLGIAYWRGVLTEWRASGLSQSEFCRQRGIHPATFSGRKRRLALWTADVADAGLVPAISSRERAGNVADAAFAGTAAFVEARVTNLAVGFASSDVRPEETAGVAVTAECGESLRRSAGIEIVFGESLSVRVDMGFDEEALHSVLRVLARSP